MNTLKKSPVIILGILFVLFGIQTFAMVLMRTPMPEMGGLAGEFMHVMFASGFIFFVKAIELLAGIMLLVPKTRNLGLLLISPIIVGILVSEVLIIMPPFAQMIPSLLVLVLAIISFYQRRAQFLALLK